MDDLPVNELFQTIQGEATHAGRPSVFLRLQGCPVGCPWCDTRHTWVVDPVMETDDWAEVTALKGESSPTWALVPVETLISLIAKLRANHVVLTGGEPCMYDLRPLSAGLIDAGRTVQVETSGTHLIQVDQRAWVTVSPKVHMPGGLVVGDDALARADEIKMPIGKPSDLVTLFALLDRGAHRPDVPIWLQPLSLSRKATDLCREAAIANNFRISLQLHALAGWR
jgi:7-carboxy-7-deazaguanine synthase